MMRLPLFFARRYLFSKKSVNAINIISLISLVGVLVSTATLVIVLSFYNGLEHFILSQYSTFSPEFRIEPRSGKLFSTDTASFETLRNLPEISSYSEVIEEKILAEYKQQQFIGRLKGVEAGSLTHLITQQMLIGGGLDLLADSAHFAILGATAQANLQVPLQQADNFVLLHTPDKQASVASVNPLEDIRTRRIQPNAMLTYQMGFEDLIIVPIDFAKELLNESQEISAIELYVNDDNSGSVQRKLQHLVGENYLVKNREQQNPTLYKTVRSEKWIVFFIVTIIGVIAIFNIIGSLTMLVIDKKQDMIVLNSLGAYRQLIQNIFFYQGLMIAFIGSLIGAVVGLGFCLLQDRFGWVRAGEGSLFDAYPVEVRYADILLILVTVLLVSTLVSYLASRLNIRNMDRRLDAENG